MQAYEMTMSKESHSSSLGPIWPLPERRRELIVVRLRWQWLAGRIVVRRAMSTGGAGGPLINHRPSGMRSGDCNRVVDGSLHCARGADKGVSKANEGKEKGARLSCHIVAQSIAQRIASCTIAQHIAQGSSELGSFTSSFLTPRTINKM